MMPLDLAALAATATPTSGARTLGGQAAAGFLELLAPLLEHVAGTATDAGVDQEQDQDSGRHQADLLRTSEMGEELLALLAPLTDHVGELGSTDLDVLNQSGQQLPEEWAQQLVGAFPGDGTVRGDHDAALTHDEEAVERAHRLLHLALRADATGRTREADAPLGPSDEGSDEELENNEVPLSTSVDSTVVGRRGTAVHSVVSDHLPVPKDSTRDGVDRTAQGDGEDSLETKRLHPAVPVEESEESRVPASAGAVGWARSGEGHVAGPVEEPEASRAPIGAGAVGGEPSGQGGTASPVTETTATPSVLDAQERAEARTSLRGESGDAAVTFTAAAESRGRPAEVRDVATVRPGTPAFVDRILEAATRLEHLPPPRHLVLELGELRVRLSLDDAGLRLQLLDDVQAGDQDLLREASEQLRNRGFDLADGEADDSSSRAANQLAEAARDEATAGNVPAPTPAAARPDTALRL